MRVVLWLAIGFIYMCLSLGLDSGWASIGLVDGYLGLSLGLGLGLVESILGLFRFHWVWCGFECLVIEAS